MCAINGLINWSGILEIEIDSVKKSLTKMQYRGPDYSQTSSDNFSALGHNRLSILDLNSRANQPMFSQDNRYSIVFNGEIYNYKILKEELISLGVNFKSTSDTEVLLNGYIFFGEKILQKLRGMFAFVIWDDTKKQDQLGQLQRDNSSSTMIFLSFFTPNRDDDNLHKKKTVWNIYLETSSGRYEGKASTYNVSNTETMVMYPYHTAWATSYKVKFPVAISSVENGTSKVIIAGPLGSKEVRFPANSF